MRFRSVSMIIGCIATFMMVLLSDPFFESLKLPVGAQTFLFVKSVVMLSIACLVVHLARKTLFDYINLGDYFRKALETPEGAGRAIQGVSIMLIAVALVYVAHIVTG